MGLLKLLPVNNTSYKETGILLLSFSSVWKKKQLKGIFILLKYYFNMQPYTTLRHLYHPAGQ